MAGGKGDLGMSGGLGGATKALARDASFTGAKQIQVGDESAATYTPPSGNAGLPSPKERKDSPGV